MSRKPCTRCKKTKPPEEFYPRQAKSGACKTCMISATRAWQDKNRERAKLNMTKWRANPKNKESQKFAAKQQMKALRVLRGEEVRQQERERYRKNPLKKQAYVAVKRKIDGGDIPHPSSLTCHSCGSPASQYHHPRGYAKEHRFDVVPICTGCHWEVHHSH
jgi:hypothetical protein